MSGEALAIVAAFVAALVISAATCAAMLALSKRRGWYDAVGGEAHKRHERPVPNTGGVGVFLGIAAPMAVALATAWLLSPGAEAGWRQHLPGLRSVTPAGLVLLGGLLAVHMTGLIDDRKSLSAWPKLVVQVVVALGVILFGNVYALEAVFALMPWGAAVAVVLAINLAWIIAVTNAINFLDNMDGLAGGVSAIVAAAYLAMACLAGQWFVAAASAAVLGACLGFLLFNYPPAKLFMGDGGSLVLGFLLAVIAVRTTYFSPGLTGSGGDGTPPGGGVGGPAWYGVLTPLVVLAVPLYDFTSVTLIRLSQGRSPLRGDHQHLSHRLADAAPPGLGLGRRGAVWAVWLCTAATAAGGVLLPRLGATGAVVVAVQTLAILGVLACLERPWLRLGEAPR